MFGQIGYGKMVSSKSRTYVAMCNTSRFDGYYFRRFTLPAGEENNTDHAAWYFLNMLDLMACLQCCFPVENMADYREHSGHSLSINPQNSRRTWREWWLDLKKWWLEPAPGSHPIKLRPLGSLVREEAY